MPAEYEPIDAQRSLVENAAAFGLTQADIAEQLGIGEKTLRKHFRDELSGGKFTLGHAARTLRPVKTLFGWVIDQLWEDAFADRENISHGRKHRPIRRYTPVG